VLCPVLVQRVANLRRSGTPPRAESPGRPPRSTAPCSRQSWPASRLASELPRGSFLLTPGTPKRHTLCQTSTHPVHGQPRQREAGSRGAPASSRTTPRRRRGHCSDPKILILCQDQKEEERILRIQASRTTHWHDKGRLAHTGTRRKKQRSQGGKKAHRPQTDRRLRRQTGARFLPRSALFSAGGRGARWGTGPGRRAPPPTRCPRARLPTALPQPARRRSLLTRQKLHQLWLPPSASTRSCRT